MSNDFEKCVENEHMMSSTKQLLVQILVIGGGRRSAHTGLVLHFGTGTQILQPGRDKRTVTYRNSAMQTLASIAPLTAPCLSEGKLPLVYGICR